MRYVKLDTIKQGFTVGKSDVAGLTSDEIGPFDSVCCVCDCALGYVRSLATIKSECENEDEQVSPFMQ
jgi:hypothetical protein